MSAVAFTAILKFKTNKRTIQHFVTISDVNGGFYVFQDGQTIVQLPAGEGVIRLVDLIISVGGTDTTTAAIDVNGQRIGTVIGNTANLNANLARQFLGAPIAFAAGASLRFTQQT